MNEPKIITDTLAQLEAAERAPDHPRSIARQSVAEWRTDASRLKLPVSNAHDDKGAPVLDVAATLAHDHHDARLGRK